MQLRAHCRRELAHSRGSWSWMTAAAAAPPPPPSHYVPPAAPLLNSSFTQLSNLSLVFVFLLFFLDSDHSDQMNEGSQVSEVTLCVQIRECHHHQGYRAVTYFAFLSFKGSSKMRIIINNYPTTRIPNSSVCLSSVTKKPGPQVWLGLRSGAAKF